MDYDAVGATYNGVCVGVQFKLTVNNSTAPLRRYFPFSSLKTGYVSSFPSLKAGYLSIIVGVPREVLSKLNN
jgi:hypothetical protein